MTDIMTIGSVNSYIKSVEMRTKWQTKKISGDMSPDSDKKNTDTYAGKPAQLQTETDNDEKNNSNDKTLRSITDKMSRGEKLTASERQYLLQKDPVTYKKLIDIETEKRCYESALRRCRTKEEVHRLRFIRAASSLAVINDVKNNPKISEEKKQEIIAGEQQRSAALQKSENEFVKEGGMSALPTESERAAAFKKLREAEHPEKKKPEEKKDDREKHSVTEKSECSKRIAAKAKAEQSYEVRKVKRAGRNRRRCTSASAAAAAAYIGNIKNDISASSESSFNEKA